MTSRSATFIDYSTTPASEQTAYFDAPVMIWNKRSSEGLSSTVGEGDASPPPSTVAEKNAASPSSTSSGRVPGAFVEHLDDNDTTNLKRKPSVGIPRDPVVRKAPADGVEDIDRSGGDDGDRSPTKGSHRRSTSLAMTDSGYASSGIAPRSQSRASGRANSIQPIPILWTDSPHNMSQRALPDDEDEDEESYRERSSKNMKDSSFKRASSLRSFRSLGPRASTAERGSIRTTPDVVAGRTSSVRRRRVSLSGGSFASGAGTVGPASSVVLDDVFHARSRSADLALTEKQKMKLSKEQVKEGKKMAKIIRAEGKAEKQALEEALNELTDLQKLQKSAIKAESKSYAAYSKALREHHKVELEFFAIRAKYERAQADLQAQEDARDASRSHARETTEMLQEKNREVEWLRAQKAVDDREREAKVRQLTGKA